jgi:hypothetical protein
MDPRDQARDANIADFPASRATGRSPAKIVPAPFDQAYRHQPPQSPSLLTMNSFRFARAALRARPAAMRVPVQRRTYAEALPDKASTGPTGVHHLSSLLTALQIKLSLSLPHQVRFYSTERSLRRLMRRN